MITIKCDNTKCNAVDFKPNIVLILIDGEGEEAKTVEMHFCSLECLKKYSATLGEEK